MGHDLVRGKFEHWRDKWKNNKTENNETKFQISVDLVHSNLSIEKQFDEKRLQEQEEEALPDHTWPLSLAMLNYK